MPIHSNLFLMAPPLCPVKDGSKASAYAAAAEPKELMIFPGANHTDRSGLMGAAGMKVFIFAPLVEGSRNALTAPGPRSTQAQSPLHCLYLTARAHPAQMVRLRPRPVIQSLLHVLGPLFFGWICGLSLHSLPGLTFVMGAGVVLAAAALGAQKKKWAMSCALTAQSYKTLIILGRKLPRPH